jgi:hypothetical protein
MHKVYSLAPDVLRRVAAMYGKQVARFGVVESGYHRDSSGKMTAADSLPYFVDGGSNLLPSPKQFERNYDGTVQLFAYTLSVQAHNGPGCQTPELDQTSFQLSSNRGQGIFKNMKWTSLHGAKAYEGRVDDGNIQINTTPPRTVSKTELSGIGVPLYIAPDAKLITAGTVITTQPKYYVEWTTKETGRKHRGTILTPSEFLIPQPKTITFE